MSAKRIEELQHRMAAAGMAAAVILYSRDLFYYTGCVQDSFLLITPKDFHLFIRRGYEFALSEGGLWLDRDRVSNESGQEVVLKKLREWKVNRGKIGLQLDIMPAEAYFKWRELLTGYEIINVSPLVLEQRKKKDAEEIALLRKACDILDVGHKRVLEVLREGITELELSVAVENAYRLAGHEGLTILRRPDFFASVALVSSGTNLNKFTGIVYSLGGVGMSTAIPVAASWKKIMKGEPVIVDKGSFYRGYHGDQTRTYVIGKANSEMHQLFQALKDINDYLIDSLEDGIKCSEVYDMAWQRARQLKMLDYFEILAPGKSTHFIAHGVGLEANEPPVIRADNHTTLHNGYVISLDMHMMHPGWGAVKLEDMVLLTNHGVEILNSTPREMFEVEG